MKSNTKRVWTSLVTTLVLMHSLIFAGYAQAAMVSTSQAVAVQEHAYQKSDLITALQQDEVKAQLVDMGVDPDVVAERVDNLTSQELAQLNQEMDNMPAGQGVLGAVVFVFLFFVVTDMLCATDLFSFVQCINR